jgi:hypothetical protein
LFQLESIVIDLNTSPFDGEMDPGDFVSMELFFTALVFNFIIESLILLFQSNNATERKIIDQLQNVRVYNILKHFSLFFSYNEEPLN